jgi:hypothetical protein
VAAVQRQQREQVEDPDEDVQPTEQAEEDDRLRALGRLPPIRLAPTTLIGVASSRVLAADRVDQVGDLGREVTDRLERLLDRLADVPAGRGNGAGDAVVEDLLGASGETPMAETVTNFLPVLSPVSGRWVATRSVVVVRRSPSRSVHHLDRTGRAGADQLDDVTVGLGLLAADGDQPVTGAQPGALAGPTGSAAVQARKLSPLAFRS